MSKKQPKLTQWFPGDVKPARKGVYEATLFGVACYQNWNGRYWGHPGHCAKTAAENDFIKYFHQNMSWRGLAVRP